VTYDNAAMAYLQDRLGWDNFLEEKAMNILKFTYIDDERFEKEGTNSRGTKGVWQN
jgi:hypothetical protein